MGVGSILLFFALVTFIAIGAAIVLGVTSRLRIIGWPILIVGVCLALWAMDYWVRVLPGILSCAALNGLIITVSGHALNQPSVAVDRLTATLATIAVGFSAFLATTFKNGPLSFLDRLAGLGVLASFAIAFAPSRLQLLGLVGIVICVVAAWATRNRRHAGRRTRHAGF
jgi:hypothetical protein